MLSKRVQSHLQGIVLVNPVDGALLGLEGPEEGVSNRGLASASPADYAYFFSFLGCEGYAFQDGRK